MIKPLNLQTQSIKRHGRWVSLAIACSFLGACANVDEYHKSTIADAQKHIDDAIQTTKATTVRTVSFSSPRGHSIEDIDERNAVSMNVRNASFFDLITRLSDRLGYGVTAMGAVDVQKQVTVNLRKLTLTQAIRQIAWQAGYAVVINEADHSVIVSPDATVVFRVPSEDLKKQVNTDFKYGGSAISGGGASGSSTSMGGAGGATSGTAINPITANFAVDGKFSTAPNNFVKLVQAQAGTNAHVEIYPEEGLISVHGNGQALKRIYDFLSRYSYNARRQIEINARLVDVELTDQFQYGVNWQKIFNASGNKNLSVNTTSSLSSTAAGSYSFTNGSITDVIEALEHFTSVNVTASPKLIINNNSGGVFFSGTQNPYMPQVTSTTLASGTGTTTSQSGTGAYAQDGVNLAVFADILDDANATLTIVPSKVTLGSLQSFLNGQVQMYQQTVQDGGQRISIQSGQTVVISGTRTTTNNNNKQAVPGLTDIPLFGSIFSGVSKTKGAQESVLILNARILRPAPVEIIVSESI